MNKIPSSILSLTVLLLHVFAMPVFFLGFILIYNSQWMSEFLNAGLGVIFNVLMITSILIGVIGISRFIMTMVGRNGRISWWQYALWSFGEVFVFSCFAALYMALVYGDYGYFPALGECLRLSFATFSYPYIIFALLFALIRPDEIEANEEDLVRFADSTGRLKLVIAHDVILYIEAQENYVSIHYMEGEKQKEYSLRQSMRGIEELMEKHGIIRCQRSYFVNPRHVTVLRRDKEGFIQAELDVNNSKPVPVSPKYYEQLSKML
ncbi:MAG: LytTR family transcriptional regulator [Paludibacteraceae bacterium]|nr:LytTR family transcriptional regulator [Paludibacteraceae bacterium]